MVPLLLFAIVLFFALTWVASSRLICPSRRPLQDYHQEIFDHPAAHGLLIRHFSVRSSDGLVTPCLLCEPGSQAGPSAKGLLLRQQLQGQGLSIPPWGTIQATLVLLHGHAGRKEDHLPVAERFCAAGFRCILLDLPGHGDNPTEYATFGLKEAALPGVALLHAAQLFGFNAQPAALFGISQGGAIALQSAARKNEGWFAIGELSGFATLDEVIASQSNRWFGLLRRPAHAVVRGLVEHRAGLSIEQVRPLDAATTLNDMAVLIGHGESDDFIPLEHAHRLYGAVPSRRKQFLNVPGANHSRVLVTSAPVYATLSEFFLRSLPAPGTK